jgi:hypothetical protein
MRKPLFRCIVLWILWRRAIAFLTIHCDPKLVQNDRRIQRIQVLDPAATRIRPRQIVMIGASKKDTDSVPEDEEAYLQDPNFIERSKRWIVIVDDEEPIRMAVGDFLYDQGYQVTACADADSMLQLCSSSSQDVIDGELGAIPDAIVR